MGWDSNPRDGLPPAGFQDRCLQPLGHPSDKTRISRSAPSKASGERTCGEILRCWIWRLFGVPRTSPHPALKMSTLVMLTRQDRLKGRRKSSAIAPPQL